MSPSSRNLLAANGATLILALILQWDAGWLLWPFWVHSVIIGWYARRRMLSLRRFSTSGFTSNGRPVPEDASGKRSTAAFFAFHYGFFHAGYLVFLFVEHPILGGWTDIAILLACGVSYAYSQRETYRAQHAADLRGRPHLGALMFLPYLRVVPMHLAIVASGTLGDGVGMVFAFMGLKTASDLLLDLADRRMAAAAARRAERAVVPDIAEENGQDGRPGA